MTTFGDRELKARAQDMLPLLRQVPAGDLARALLAGLRACDIRPRFPSLLQDLYNSPDLLADLWRATAVMRFPLCRGELLLWAFVSLPGYLALQLFGYPMLTIVVGLFGLCALAGRTRVASGLLPLSNTADLRLHSDLIAPYVNNVWQWRAGTGSISRRGPRSLLLAETILTHDHIGWETLSKYSPAELRRAVEALIGNGLLGPRADIVLASMGDRSLLEAATAVRPKSRPQPAARKLEPREHDEQLRCLLPMAGNWKKSFGIVGALASFCTVFWMLVLRQLLPSSADGWIGSYDMVQVLVLTLYLALLQHMALSPSAAQNKDVFLQSIKEGFGILVFVLLLLEGVDWWTGYHTRIRMIRVLGPLVITNFLVLEFLAHWRGVGLIYPTTSHLWRRRILCALLLLGSCALLALVARLVI
jgi:hypothetical protein